MAKLVADLGIIRGTFVYLEEGGALTAYVQGANCGRWEEIFVSRELDVHMVPARKWKCALKLAG